MALVFNALSKKVSVQVAGSWFEFGPEQVKLIHNPNVAQIMCVQKATEGLVAVPDIVFEDAASPEAKKIKEEARQQGINNRIRFLKTIIHNLEVSLRRDMDMKGMKNVDTDVMASEGEIAAYRELATLKDAQKAHENAKLDEIKKLREKVSDGDSVITDKRKSS